MAPGVLLLSENQEPACGLWSRRWSRSWFHGEFAFGAVDNLSLIRGAIGVSKVPNDISHEGGCIDIIGAAFALHKCPIGHLRIVLNGRGIAAHYQFDHQAGQGRSLACQRCSILGDCDRSINWPGGLPLLNCDRGRGDFNNHQRRRRGRWA